MNKRTALWISVTLFISLSGAAVHAQNDPLWAAWLFNPITGNLTRIEANGQAVNAGLLPLSPPYDSFEHVFVAPGARYFGYSLYDSTSARPRSALILYDLRRARTL